MLLNSVKKKKVERVKLTVGKYKDSISKGLVYGYADSNCGSLDKVPYWEDVTLGTHYYLDTFADFMLYGKSQINLNSDNVEDFSYEAFSLDIKIAETDTTISCNFKKLPSTCTNRLFGFSQMVGQTVTLEFDPPPTAIYKSSSNHLFNGGGLNVREGNASADSRRKRRNRCVGNSSTKRMPLCRGNRSVYRQCKPVHLSQEYLRYLGSTTDKSDVANYFISGNPKPRCANNYKCCQCGNNDGLSEYVQHMEICTNKPEEKSYSPAYLVSWRIHNSRLTSCMGGSHA